MALPQARPPAGSPPVTDLSQLQHRPAQQSDDVIRVFYFESPAPPSNTQSIATVIRSLTEIRRAFLSSAAGAFVVRGTQEQIDIAAWLVDAFDKPSFVARATQHSITDPVGENMIRLFVVPKFASEEELKNFATELRMVTQMRRVFPYYPLRVIAVRSTPAQIAQASKLVDAL